MSLLFCLQEKVEYRHCRNIVKLIEILCTAAEYSQGQEQRK